MNRSAISAMRFTAKSRHDGRDVARDVSGVEVRGQVSVALRLKNALPKSSEVNGIPEEDAGNDEEGRGGEGEIFA